MDEVQSISPDVITEELIESVDHGKEDLAGEGDIEVCDECMAELKGD
ncbi:hypothetical protein ACODNH_23655 (plasmid) [Haloarcula sp. NS06]